MAGVPGKPRAPSIYDNAPDYRMSMLPFGTYADDSGGEHLGWAMPGMITEPANALYRLMGTPSNPGTFTQGPDAPGNADDMTTLLLSLYGGNALNPVRGIESAAATIPKVLRADLEGTTPLRAYHGMHGELTGGEFARDMAGTNFDNPMSRAGVSFADDPAIAESYARSAVDRFQRNSETPEEYADRGRGIFPFIGEPMRGANILPVDIYGRGAKLDRGVEDIGTERLARQIDDLKSQGYDYAVFPSDRESRFGRSDGMEISVWSPNTVKSPLTGETLFSDTGKPSLLGSAIASARDHAQAAYRSARYPSEVAIGPTLPTDFEVPRAGGPLQAAPVPGDRWTGNGVESLQPDMTEIYAKNTQRGYRGEINDLDGLSGPDMGYLNALLRQRKIDDGTLFSDTGRPSLLGSAIAALQARYNNSFYDY